ncbi:Rpn family recombination-promoting nuclease/putative transposase [Rivularia sp. UHCC 0363]|uniref:Rpn family recombination-promoting nuclease/putative transposase n=1 Tax=Rivularia sp. UHCC 0363 TaxID=3110244 RepID=UPI002B216288|nr:Rpn family recombination-promoting nuclease/putative transposase [Rivularia sp. UHCC 0363]MEA5597418.1 Rpn family recombination-promoting nuclease/putative transposase [Rivularia sp. UHCC 0363]
MQKLKTDTLFYDLVRELPQLFFELIGKPETDTNIYTFTAQEVKDQSFRLDGLLSTVTGSENEPLYLVEFQTYKDEEFYERIFGQLFVYFRQYRPPNPQWYLIVIYDRRSNETPPHPRYQTLVKNHLHRIYLKELPDDESLATGIAKLFVETRKKTSTLAQRLMSKATEEISDENNQKKVLAFIQSIVVKKFPKLSKEEIEAMLNLGDDIEKTGYYQSVKREIALKAAKILLEEGDTIERVAKGLDLDIEEVRKLAEKNRSIDQ